MISRDDIDQALKTLSAAENDTSLTPAAKSDAIELLSADARIQRFWLYFHDPMA